MEIIKLVNSSDDQRPLQTLADWCIPKWSAAALHRKSTQDTQKSPALPDDGFESGAGEHTLSSVLQKRIHCSSIPSIAGAAHTHENALLRQACLIPLTRLFASSIALMQERKTLALRVSTCKRHSQSERDQFFVFGGGHWLADHAPRKEVENDSQREPSFLRCNHRPIRDPLRSGCIRAPCRTVGRPSGLDPSLGISSSKGRVKIMAKTIRTFPKEFKLEAVQLVQSSQKSQAQIARDLGIADSTSESLVQKIH